MLPIRRIVEVAIMNNNFFTLLCFAIYSKRQEVKDIAYYTNGKLVCFLVKPFELYILQQCQNSAI